MDVRMPDGTIIQNVPDGTTQDEVLRRYQAGARSSGGEKPYDPLDDMTGMQRFLAGMGKRMLDIGTLGMRDAPESDRALMQTGAGMAGGAVTDIGSMLAGGAALRGAGTAAAGKAPQIAGRAQRLGQSMIAPKTITDAGSAGLYYGALTTPGGLSERATAAATGAAGGMAGQALGQGLVAGARAARNAFSPDAKVVEALTRHSGLSADDLAAAISAGNTTLVEGSKPTTAQAAMNPGLSQLARTLHNRSPIPFTLAREAQDEARRKAMEGIGAPTGANAREVAEDVGQLIARRTAPQRTAWQVDREAAYRAIDPGMQSRIAAPIQQVDEIIKDIFSPGAGKPTAELSSLIGDMKKLSKQTDDLLEKARVAKGVVNPDKHSLGDAIRIWGGLNSKQGGGEVRWLKESDLGNRSALGSFASNKGRLSLARATEKAHELGYLPEEDINLLLDKLAEEAGGSPQFSIRMGEEALARARGGIPEAPDAPAVLPWRTLENLRARANAIVRNPALAQSADQKAAIKIRGALDAEMERAASGASPVWGESFTPDMIERAQAARRIHAEGKQRFDTGPARDVFRYGSDGLPKAQGAEVVRGFINASDSQVADAQQFMRMVGDDKGSVEAARRYALADLMQFAGSERAMSPSKFKGWVDSRKPMLDVLFPKDQAKQIMAVRNDLLRAKDADNLARAVGSNTMQNFEGSNALTRALSVGALARLPVVGRYAGALESAAREAERVKLTELLTPAMVSPDLALDAIMRQRLGLLGAGADRVPQGLGLLGVPSALTIPGLMSVNAGQ
jgi:hypothetical protein